MTKIADLEKLQPNISTENDDESFFTPEEYVDDSDCHNLQK